MPDDPTWADTTDAPTWEETSEPLDLSKSLAKPGQLDASGRKPYAGPLSAGPFSAYQPENMQEAVDLLSSLNEPPFHIPKIRPGSTLGKIAASPVNVASGLAEGITSPIGAASLFVGGPVVKGVFAGLAAKEAGRALGEASVTVDPGQIAEGVIGAGLAPMIALHGSFPERGEGFPAAPDPLEIARRSGLPPTEPFPVQERISAPKWDETKPSEAPPAGESGQIADLASSQVDKAQVKGQLAAMLGVKEQHKIDALLQNPDTKQGVRILFQESYPPEHWRNLAQEFGGSPSESYDAALLKAIDVTDQAKRALGKQVPPAGESGEAKPGEAPVSAAVESPVKAGETPQAIAESGTTAPPEQAGNVTGDVTDESKTPTGELDNSQEQLKFASMGNAVPSEFDPTGGPVTSIKNAVVDQERIKRGLPPAMEPVRRDFGQVWDRAMAIIDHDPGVTDRLLDELRTKPRALNDVEDALVLHRQVDLQNEYNKATRDLAQAHDDGRTDAVATERQRVANLSDQLHDLYNIGKASGTETGRGLNARKMLANEDFTLASMEIQSRAAKGGQKLTEQESATVKSLHDKIAATQKAYDDYRAGTEEKLAKMEIDRLASQAEPKAPALDKRVLDAAESIVKRMENAAVDASQRLRDRLSRMSAGVDPLIVSDAAIVGSAKIARLGLDATKFADEMIRDFGEKIRPMIGDIWTASNKLIDQATSKAPEVVRRAVKKTGLTEVKASATKAIADKFAKGQKDKITWETQRLARSLVESGITDREKLIDAVHQVLQDAIPGITRREAMDAISGYGDYRQLSKDAISVQLRGMKGEMMELSKLEDMALGKPPLKSGVQRGETTEARRQLIKRVNDAKYKFQVPVSDPETQLQSALDTLKKTLTNRIKDYEDRIAREDYATRPRRTVELDREASRLKAESERVKKRFQRGVQLERLKNRTPVERGADWVTKWRRGFILSGPVTLAKLTSAGVQRVLFSPLEELAGSAIGKAFPRVASRAAREGGFNVKAEANSITQSLTQGMTDAWKTLRTGQSDLDVLHGKEALLPPTAIDFFGHVHGALKAPVKRAEFARSFEKRTAAAIASGIDTSDPMVHSGLVIAAYKDANRAIFQQDNRVVSAYKLFLHRLEMKDKATGRIPLAGKAAATAARVLLPIVKIPTNIVAETMQYATGAITGSARLARAYRAGIESLKPEEADLIMRSLKKGSLGAAVMLTGFFNPQVVGGYYQPGQKRPASDVKAGNIRLYGLEIPSYLLHNPLTETLQIGATVRRVAESKLRKSDTQPQGLGAGLMAAARGQAEAVPFVKETTVLSKALNPMQSDSFWGDLARSLIVPQAVQSAATYLDKTPSGEPVKRKPRTVMENIKSGIPFLREEVPKKK